jgi:DNA invertase Pin-like site-specific DNA recombinase
MPAASFEREQVGQRTSDALQALKTRGRRLGRPVALPEQIRARIAPERAQGRSLRAIAHGLNTDEIATAQGGQRWYPSTVRSVLHSIDRDVRYPH